MADAGGDPFAPGTSSFMVNYRVEDLHALVRTLREEGCNVLDRIDESEYGKFAGSHGSRGQQGRALGAACGSMTGAAASPADPGDFRFVPLGEPHLRMLLDWLARPHVARWWTPTPSVDALRADYVTRLDAPGATRAYIAHCRGAAVGFIQCYVVMGSPDGWWPGETDAGARGIDAFLADARRLGQGLGSAMVRAFVQALFEDPRVTVIQTDPHPANERAIRSYRRAGFRAVGPVATPDGPALLMRCARAPDAATAAA